MRSCRWAANVSALIELGSVGAPFGVRGWVKLRSYTEPPDAVVRSIDVLHLGVGGEWAAYRIEATGRSGGQLTAKFAGVNDRDRAQSVARRGYRRAEKRVAAAR